MRSLNKEVPPQTDPEYAARISEDSELSPDQKARLVQYVDRLIRGEVFVGDAEDVYRVPLLENVWVSVCFSCSKPSLWVHDHIVHPPVAAAGIEPNEDLTDEIKADFREAGQILNASPRGAAALLRLCIQKLCIQLGEPGKNLNDDIANLVSKGLDPHVQQALDIVRVVGNNAVHPGQIDLRDNRDTALKLFELVNVIADELITRPAKVQKLYVAVVPEADRQRIARRDKS